jgi:hypothetical protein
MLWLHRVSPLRSSSLEFVGCYRSSEFALNYWEKGQLQRKMTSTTLAWREVCAVDGDGGSHRGFKKMLSTPSASKHFINLHLVIVKRLILIFMIHHSIYSHYCSAEEPHLLIMLPLLSLKTPLSTIS